jgi:elongation factor P
MSVLSFNEIRKGKIVVLDGEPYVVFSAEFLRKQQRRPVIRSVLKHLKTGQNREHSFQQSDKVAEADVETKPFQFLFGDEHHLTFMDQATYEQIEIDRAVMGDAASYLLDGQEVQIVFFEGNPVTVDLPIKITRTVVETAPGVRGNTAGNVLKDAKIEGGLTVRVPAFITDGNKIVVDTRDGSYVERA